MLAMTVVPGKPASAAVADIAEPVESDGAVLVEGIAIGVCGTDREIIASSDVLLPPSASELILGHESLGRVISAPDGCGVLAGDTIVGIVRRPDDCACCRNGEWDFCRTGQYTERGIRGAHGYGAQRWRIPPEYVVSVDPSLGLLGVLVEPASVVAKAWEQIDHIRGRGCAAGRTALITGAGPIGLLAALFAVQRGYQTHVLDLAETGPKPRLTRALGAAYHTGDVDDIGVEPDVVVEATGVGQLVFDLLDATARNAVVCLTGIASGTQPLRIAPDQVNRNLVTGNGVVFGTVNAARRHYEQAIAALRIADPTWLTGLITRQVPLTHWTDALDKQPDDVKVVVDLTR